MTRGAALFPRLIITRPQPEAGRWVEGLRLGGQEAVALPLLEIGALESPELALARARPGEWRAVMFVSPAAVNAFFAGTAAQGMPGREGWERVRWLATGPGTVRALLGWGLRREWIDAPPEDAPQFDSEALWQVVGQRDWAGARVLIVRGGGEESSPQQQGRGRDWLANQFRAAGARVDVLAAYERRAPVWDAPTRALALQASRDGSAWVFSSSEAVGHLRTLLPQADWGATPCICTHERIAQATAASGFSRIMLCRPALADLLALCHAQ